LPAAAPAGVGNAAALVRAEGVEEPPPEEPEGIRGWGDCHAAGRDGEGSFVCVQDLLSMEKGTVVETVHDHSQDVPVRCGGAPLVWRNSRSSISKLAVRITRLA